MKTLKKILYPILLFVVWFFGWALVLRKLHTIDLNLLTAFLVLIGIFLTFAVVILLIRKILE